MTNNIHPNELKSCHNTKIASYHQYPDAQNPILQGGVLTQSYLVIDATWAVKAL